MLINDAWIIIFWSSICLLIYSYVGYGIVLYAIVRMKRMFFRKQSAVAHFEPPVTFMVAAYNEGPSLREKIENTLALDYPAHLLKIVFVTDGSTDETNDVVRSYPDVQLLFEPGRKGKTAAINRAMQLVNTPFVVFSDANTLLSPPALRLLLAPFADGSVGAVAGEKKVRASGDAATSGEGIYWKYESLLKKWDAELYSVMGAAGELFAVRTSLYDPIPDNTILDDFVISFNINRKDYRVDYVPAAYALEHPSASLAEEYKRKVRISAGGFQAMGMQLPILNFLRFPKLTWQYVSHRVLRWTLAPLCLGLVFIANAVLAVGHPSPVYKILLAAQVAFYAAAAAGYWLALQGRKVTLCYVPFYFLFMNVAVFHGFGRFLQRRQSAAWERSKRAG